jgi:IS30 family transposase
VIPEAHGNAVPMKTPTACWQYFPKGTDLSPYTQQHLDEIALKLNTRPRKTLGFMTLVVSHDETKR